MQCITVVLSAFWGNGVPPLMSQGINKGIEVRQWVQCLRNSGREAPIPQTIRVEQGSGAGKKRKAMTALWATIPTELSSCVADYAERITEKESVA